MAACSAPSAPSPASAPPAATPKPAESSKQAETAKPAAAAQQAPAKTGSKVKLRYWHVWGADRIPLMDAQVKAFQEKFPDIEVEHHIHVDVEWGTENMFAQVTWTLLPVDSTAAIGPLFGRWYESGGKEGKEPPARIKEAMQAYRSAFSAPEAEHVELAKTVWRIAIDEVWTIGTVGLSPAIQGTRIAKTSLGNVPSRMVNGASIRSPGQTRPGTYFYKS